MLAFEFVEKSLKIATPNYAGRWRIILDVKYKDNNEEKRECKIGYGDLYIE